MSIVPIAGDAGLYQVLTSANTDYPVAVPTSAVAVLFEIIDSTGTPVRGRIALTGSATLIGSLTGTDGKMGYLPAVPIELRLETQYDRRDGVSARNTTHLHLASSTAGAIVRGTWLASS